MTGGDFKEDSPEIYVAVTLDRIGQRYGLLPSEVLSRASTLDIIAMDVSISYERMKNSRSQGQVPEMRQEDMLAALKQRKQQ